MIGIGNQFRQDDGAGPAVARLLGGRVDDRFDVLEHDGDGTSLLDAWEGARFVILVDAVRSGEAPGTIHRIDIGQTGLPDSAAWRSSHSVGLAEAVNLASRLGRLPLDLLVYGIEGRRFGFGSALSPEVEAAVHAVADEIRRRLSPRALNAEDRR